MSDICFSIISSVHCSVWLKVCFFFLLEFMAVVNIDFTYTYFLPLNTGSSFETNSHHRPIHFNNSGQSVESVNDGFSSYLVSHSLHLTALPPQTDPVCKALNYRDRKCISTIFTPIECCSFPAVLSAASKIVMCPLSLLTLENQSPPDSLRQRQLGWQLCAHESWLLATQCCPGWQS